MFIDIHPAIFGNSAWSNMFTLDETATWIKKTLRPMIFYATLIFLLRVFDQRELSQLIPFDFVVILSLSNTVQNAIIGQDNSLVGGLVGACALLGTNYLVAIFKFKSVKIERLIEGAPLILIEGSKINKAAVKSELLTDEDLNTIAHRVGLSSADEIEKCVLDPNGNFPVEGNTRTSEENFRQEVLKRLEDLTHKLGERQKTI